MPPDALFIHLISGLLISQISSLLDKYSICSPPPAARRSREWSAHSRSLRRRRESRNMSETAKALWWEADNVFMKTNRWLFRKPFQFSSLLIRAGKQDTLERALWVCTYCPKRPEIADRESKSSGRRWGRRRRGCLAPCCWRGSGHRSNEW